jgi:glucan endo-1,3-beta-D-glucosidase
MKRLLIYFLFSPCLAQAASKIYTGFNYGAFWAVEANAKKKDDFLDGFGLARNLSTDTPFDSARLFTCKQAGTLNEPIEAFDAAVQSKTNLLLGFWISPAQKGGSTDDNVKNEMTALEKGFRKHGKALADLVIGLSVGNEDIYRNEETPDQVGVPADVVSQTINQVKTNIAASSFAKYMEDKPIGHVDTAKYAVVDNADFIGMTVYPYWNKDGIDNAAVSLQGSLDDVRKRAGDRPVWIAEIGWPVADNRPQKDTGAAVAGTDQLQKFWTEVGCTVTGKYTTFWFELLNDSDAKDQPDWGFVDIPSRQSRVKNLSCGTPNQSPPAAPPANSQLPPSAASSAVPSATSSAIVSSQCPAPVLSLSPPAPTLGSSISAVPPNDVNSTVYLTTVVTMYTTVSARLSVGKVSSQTSSMVQAPLPSTGEVRSTITVTTTGYTTITPTLGAPVPSISDGLQPMDATTTSTITEHVMPTSMITVHAKPSSSPSTQPAWCEVYANENGDGQPELVGVEPADADGKCPPPPPYSSGYPQTLNAPVSIASDSSAFTFILASSSISPPADPAAPTPDSSVAPSLSGSNTPAVPASSILLPPVSSSAAAAPIASTAPASGKFKCTSSPSFSR